MSNNDNIQITEEKQTYTVCKPQDALTILIESIAKEHCTVDLTDNQQNCGFTLSTFPNHSILGFKVSFQQSNLNIGQYSDHCTDISRKQICDTLVIAARKIIKQYEQEQQQKIQQFIEDTEESI